MVLQTRPAGRPLMATKLCQGSEVGVVGVLEKQGEGWGRVSQGTAGWGPRERERPGTEVCMSCCFPRRPSAPLSLQNSC